MSQLFHKRFLNQGTRGGQEAQGCPRVDTRASCHSWLDLPPEVRPETSHSHPAAQNPMQET